MKSVRRTASSRPFRAQFLALLLTLFVSVMGLAGANSYAYAEAGAANEATSALIEVGDSLPRPFAAPAGSGSCADDCDFTGQAGAHQGHYFLADDTIEWAVYVPATAQGMMPIGVPVTVTSNLDLSLFGIIGDPVVYRAGSVYLPMAGGSAESPSNQDSLTPDQYSLNADNRSVTFTTAPGLGTGAQLPAGERGLEGSVYLVVWKVKVLDNGAAGTYTSTADWRIDGIKSAEVVTTVTRPSGGLTTGADRGKFAITKVLAEGSEIPQGTEFNLRWTRFNLDDPGAPGVSGSTYLQVGDTYFSAEIDPNSRVVIHEAIPTDPAGFEWGSPRFIETNSAGEPLAGATPSESLTLDFLSSPRERLGHVSYFTLTNTLTKLPAELGSISINNIVEGDAADLVAAHTEFEVAYSWPASDNHDAGSGTITVPATGEFVTVGEIPAGTLVTLAAGDLPVVDGASWGTPVFTLNSFTIEADTVTEVTLTNTLEFDPVDPAAPVDPGNPVKPPADHLNPDKTESIARTGSETGPRWIMAPALLALLAGSILLSRGSRARGERALKQG